MGSQKERGHSEGNVPSLGPTIETKMEDEEL